jgi:Protein of unknown function (DUF1501)
MRPTRRQTLAGLLAAPFLAGFGKAPTGAPRKLLLVFNHGGWDTTRVISPMFGAPGVAMERGSTSYTAGNLELVDHPSRPSARALFTGYHERIALVHGMLVPSVAHEVCTRLVMTGSTRTDADWGARIAALDPAPYVLPNLVLEAPSFPEEHALYVSRAGGAGQLDGLVNGSIGDGTTPEVEAMPLAVQGLVDRHVLARANAAAADPGLAAFAESAARAVALKDEKYAVRFATGGDLGSRTQVAVDALAAGITRVATIGYPSLFFPWDSHTDNDGIQGVLWEELCRGLLDLMEQLDGTPGTAGGTMFDETVVAVVSEMGRTPALNTAGGKDHWPYTSAILFGSGVQGDATVGGYRQNFAGQGVDRETWALDEAAPLLDTASLGATLLALAGAPTDVAPLAPLLA